MALKTTIEVNGVTVALASSEEQAAEIERFYRDIADGLEGRLERRGRTVYLWRFRSSPTQRQAMYDCQYLTWIHRFLGRGCPGWYAE